MKKKNKKKVKKCGKTPKTKTQECLNNIRIRFPTYENECYAKQTRILRTMVADRYTYEDTFISAYKHIIGHW